MKRLRTTAIAVLFFAASASSAVASAGPVGQWALDEGAGTTATDSSGNGDNGVISGAATWLTGPTGTALSFDGSFGQVKILNNPVLEPPTSVSVAAWVSNDGSPGAYRYILAKGATGCIAASYGLYTGPNGGLEFYVSQSRGTVYARSPDDGTGVWDGDWHLVVGTFDGTTIRLYVDGLQVGSGTLYPGNLEYLLPDSNDLYIGNYPGCETHEFSGEIDEVAVWNRALSASDVQSLTGGSGTGSSNGGTGSGSSTTGGQPASGPAPSGGSSTGGSSTGGSSTGGSTSTGTRSLPVITHLRLSPTTIATVAAAGSRKHSVHPTWATLSYSDSKAASSTMTLTLSETGIVSAGRCLAPSSHASGRGGVRCTRWVTIGSFTHVDRAGANSMRFAGVPRHKLVAGHYRLELVPRAHGVAGRDAVVSFAVVAA